MIRELLKKKIIMKKTWYQTSEIQKLIDWENIMKMPRCAGGHHEQMKGLIKGAQVIGHFNSGDWQGVTSACVKLESGEFAIYSDYYGSCSGCDSWEDASDEEIKRLCISLANSAYIFKSMDDVVDFLKNFQNVNEDGNDYRCEYYKWCSEGNAIGLLKEIRNYK